MSFEWIASRSAGMKRHTERPFLHTLYHFAWKQAKEETEGTFKAWAAERIHVILRSLETATNRCTSPQEPHFFKPPPEIRLEMVPGDKDPAPLSVVRDHRVDQHPLDALRCGLCLALGRHTAADVDGDVHGKQCRHSAPCRRVDLWEMSTFSFRIQILAVFIFFSSDGCLPLQDRLARVSAVKFSPFIGKGNSSRKLPSALSCPTLPPLPPRPPLAMVYTISHDIPDATVRLSNTSLSSWMQPGVPVSPPVESRLIMEEMPSSSTAIQVNAELRELYAPTPGGLTARVVCPHPCQTKRLPCPIHQGVTNQTAWEGSSGRLTECWDLNLYPLLASHPQTLNLNPHIPTVTSKQRGSSANQRRGSYGCRTISSRRRENSPLLAPRFQHSAQRCSTYPSTVDWNKAMSRFRCNRSKMGVYSSV